MMELAAGQRFLLNDEYQFAVLRSGRVEVYAATRRRVSFRQMFLMELHAGDAAFPSLDEFDQIDVVLYAVEDAHVECLPLDGSPPSALQPWMRRWFGKLVALPWLGLLADHGDDVLLSWRDGTAFLGEGRSAPALLETFVEQEQIFSMLLGIRFRAEDRKLSDRIGIRSRYRRQLVDETIGNLFQEETGVHGDLLPDDGWMEEATYIVRHIASALSMPTEDIWVSPTFVRHLDPLGLLRRLMQKGNMQMRFVELMPGWQQRDSGVMLGYYAPAGESGEKKELAAILPVAPGKYRIVTKSHPKGIPVTADVAGRVERDAFACYAGLPMHKLKAMDLAKFMFRQCWKEDLQKIFLCSLIAGLVPLAMPIITESIFQDILPILDRQGLATITQIMMVTSFTLASASLVRSIAVMRVSMHVDMKAEAALWGRLLSLPTKFFRRFPAGELAQRMMGLSAVKGLVNGQFISMVFDFLFSFWSLLLMCYYSLKLTAAASLLWVLYGILSMLICRRVVGFQRKMIAARNKTAGVLQQIFTGLAKFRIQGAEEQAYHLWGQVFGEEWKWNLKLRWQNNYLSIISSIQPFLLMFILYDIVIDVVNAPTADGRLTGAEIGYAQFLAFQSAFTSFNASLNNMIPAVGEFMGIQPYVENLRPILQEQPEVSEDRVDAEVLSGTVEVSHLSFAYGEEEQDVLQDVSFRVAAGEHVAIVGRSGCGKSTLLRLLLGFEEPKQGAVYYDGQDLAGLSLSSVRSQMGVVLQNGQLMSGDLYLNIIGAHSLTMDDAWAAAEAAGIAEDIRQMPMGMQTMVSEGSTNLSGGQRQRILIARALASRPAILIFDEATSALDNRTQAIVAESLNRLHTTRIVVAHRLSTIRDCDRILVMDEGRIVESGSYDELVAKGGLFARLVERQVA